jgi:hypothetical protein
VALQTEGSSAAKTGVDFAALTARLKPRPFKTKSRPEFFRKLFDESTAKSLMYQLFWHFVWMEC